MEQLTADGGSKELDRALADAIWRLIAEQSALIGSPDEHDSQPVP